MHQQNLSKSLLPSQKQGPSGILGVVGSTAWKYQQMSCQDHCLRVISTVASEATWGELQVI